VSAKNVNSEQELQRKHRLASIEGWTAIALNVVLFVLKYIAGIMTGSVAIIADAWHTISDSFTSLVVLIGTRAARKPADSQHPFGHGRAELIAAIIIGMLLAMVGFNFIVEGIEKLQTKGTTTFAPFAVIIIAASVVVKEGMAQFSLWAFRKTGSKPLKADGWHHRSDAITSSLVLIGVLLSRKFWWIDGVMAFAVAVLILYAAYDILKDTINPLLGETPDKQLIEQISNIARKSANGPVQVHHIHIHRYGDHTELTFHIMLSPAMSLQNAHEIATIIENAIQNELDMTATIHLEPEH
jgi:cation diffusion facilitator family transporter